MKFRVNEGITAILGRIHRECADRTCIVLTSSSSSINVIMLMMSLLTLVFTEEIYPVYHLRQKTEAEQV